MLVVCLLGVSASFLAEGCSTKSNRAVRVACACAFGAHSRVGPNTITCKLTGVGEAPISGARVSLEADMSHAGMGPVFAQAKEASPGTYTGTLDLNMRGEWVVSAHIVLPDGKTLDQEMKIQNLEAS